MGWFDEQIKQRIKNDEDSFSQAFADMSGVVMGKAAVASAFGDNKQTQDAIEDILRYYHVSAPELPDNITDINDQLEYLMRPFGIMRRNVKLEGKWYKDCYGALLGMTKSGNVVALLPKGLSGYEFFDRDLGKKVKVNKETAKLLSDEAICFYKPLPLKELSAKDLLIYIKQTLSSADYVMLALATLAVTLLGLFTPYVNSLLFGSVVPSGRMNMLVAVAVLLVGVTVSSALLGITKSLILSRIETKLSISVQSASMMRVLSLPADFFKRYSSGELAGRIKNVEILCNTLSDIILTSGFSALFSLIYIFQIFNYAPSLVLPAICIIAVTVIFTIITAIVQMRVAHKQISASVKEKGFVFSILSGVQKIKLSGSEKRAFAKWANMYKKSAQYKYDPPAFVKISDVISSCIALLGTVVIYYFAVKSKVSVSEYMAFNSSYAMVSAAFLQVAGMVFQISNVKPMLTMIQPILKTVPEVSQGKNVVTRLSGAIELNNVSFKYNENMPNVIDNLSLKIRPGQYVAIVGTTGCGKSTLMRLMLGFETPNKGAVYYDGKDLQALDLKSLRRHIGTVMQNGKLFSGDIYSNIVISAPWLTLDDAWRAAEMAGIADDIRSMPMGMHTIISEGSGGISGGQRQRLMIARAVAPKARILMFDEATSALDNITQKIVSQSLDSLKCTRIVIAHRLSTIRQCDRIIVLDKGKIAEDGTYDELINKGGVFSELVERQRLDVSSE